MAKRRTKKASSKGLGDTVADVIDKLPEPVVTFGKKAKMKLLGLEDCGCAKDKDKLNKWWRGVIGQPVNLPTDEEIDYLAEHLPGHIKRREMSLQLVKISDRLFNTNSGNRIGQCGPCAKNHLTKLEKVYSQYK